MSEEFADVIEQLIDAKVNPLKKELTKRCNNLRDRCNELNDVAKEQSATIEKQSAIIAAQSEVISRIRDALKESEAFCDEVIEKTNKQADICAQIRSEVATVNKKCDTNNKLYGELAVSAARDSNRLTEEFSEKMRKVDDQLEQMNNELNLSIADVTANLAHAEANARENVSTGTLNSLDDIPTAKKTSVTTEPIYPELYSNSNDAIIQQIEDLSHSLITYRKENAKKFVQLRNELNTAIELSQLEINDKFSEDLAKLEDENTRLIRHILRLKHNIMVLSNNNSNDTQSNSSQVGATLAESMNDETIREWFKSSDMGVSKITIKK